jgi:hypothetical protein
MAISLTVLNGVIKALILDTVKTAGQLGRSVMVSTTTAMARSMKAQLHVA